jgi:DNA invertase Pin-like site-specific DNA recombinase
MTKMKAIDKQKYEQLKSLLSYGDVTSISRKLKCCRGTVYNVLNGSSQNVKVLEEIAKILSKKINLMQKLESTLKVYVKSGYRF